MNEQLKKGRKRGGKDKKKQGFSQDFYTVGGKSEDLKNKIIFSEGRKLLFEMTKIRRASFVIQVIKEWEPKND